MKWFKKQGKLVNGAFDNFENNLDDKLSDDYIREHRILKGKFSYRQWRESSSNWTNTTAATQAEDWSITYKGKKYTSPTREFEFVLEDDLVIDEPWFFTGEPHEGNSPFRAKFFESLILPKCKAVGDTSHLFQFQPDLQYLDISKLDTSESTDLSNMLQECSYKGLCIKGIENIDTSKSVSVENLFDNSNEDNHCPANPYVYNFGNATNINGLFAGYKGDLNIRRFNFNIAKTASGLFKNFKGTIDLNSTEAAMSTIKIFDNCFENTDVEQIIFKRNNMRGHGASVTNMFKGCKAKYIDTGNILSDNFVNGDNMFDDCVNLETLIFYVFLVYNKMGFANCISLKNIIGLFNIYPKQGPVYFGDSPLTKDTAISIISKLKSSTISAENAILTFSQITYDSLTEEDITVATSKGWTIIRAA